MKKNNQKGFTLIELLAVITIMGILMIVAIPAVTRTIENSRKDTFINTVKKYIRGLENMWASDSLSCNGIVSSAVQPGAYYVEIDSSSKDVPQLLESGGKSPWGNRDIRGVIVIVVYDDTIANTTNATRKVDYYPVMVDGIHGINISGTLIMSSNLKRGNLVMTGAEYTEVADEAGANYVIRPRRVILDLNDDGDWDDTVNGIAERGVESVKCIET